MYDHNIIYWQILNFPQNRQLKTSPKFPAIQYLYCCMYVKDINDFFPLIGEQLYICGSKLRLGSDATYQKLIDIFENAGYRTYAEIIRNTTSSAEFPSETDDFSDYNENIFPNQNLIHIPNKIFLQLVEF